MRAEREFKVGSVQIEGADLVGAADQAIFVPAPSRWYALRVAPQREEQAEAWLKRRGVYAFHPVLLRKSLRFGKVREYQRRYLPGYVFARFRGEPLVHRVRSCPFIIGALARQDGTWGILEPRRMGQLHTMRNMDVEAEVLRNTRAAQRRANLSARPGDTAVFAVGAFAGQRCEVVELEADGGAKVWMRLFGCEVLVSTPIDRLELAAMPA